MMRDPHAIARRMAELRVGEEVRRLREGIGISLRELARRVDLSPAMVSDIEHGRRGTSKLADIAEQLGVTAQYFADIAGVCPTCGGSGLAPQQAPGGDGSDGEGGIV